MAINESWITAVENDAAASDAVLLAKSLRRTHTGKKILVIPSTSISSSLWNSLLDEFDSVIPLDLGISGNSSSGWESLGFEEKVKICLHGTRLFQTGIFLSPSIIVVQNIDWMFETMFKSPNCGLDEADWQQDTNNFNLNSPVFALQPSQAAFSFLKERFILNNQNTLHQELQDLGKMSELTFCTYGADFVSWTVEDVQAQSTHFVKLPNGYSSPSFDISGQIFQDNRHPACKVLSEVLTSVTNSRGHCAVGVPLEKMREEPIAIVGMAGRFPGSNDIDEFWNFLMEKGDGISKVPEWRWKEEEVKEISDLNRSINGGFLKCPVEEFDANFFGMSRKELEFTDPQQRLLLEVSWEALEDAAIDATSIKGTQTGIFTGTWRNDYEDLMRNVGFEDNEFFRKYMGNSFGATAGRLAHFYETTGSNIATESGCSSSMVAVGLACKSLRRHETSLGLACGVNLLLKPFQKTEMEAFCADDGHCKTFDVAADGFGRAEGCGVLVLKRISDAVRDKDNIRAVIRGYGEAQEGPSKSQGTPTVDVEALAMSLALKQAEVSPSEVTTVEAHGTGTPVGDPMEMEAIAKVYASKRTSPLLVTSVKANVGHTESCSGITGIIKTVLSMQREIIPPHRELKALNPKIDLSKIPAEIPLVAVPWKKENGRKRIAGVSSFGITGTDAHVILEEPPTLPVTLISTPKRATNILALSALTEQALKELLKKYENKFQTVPLNWEDVTFTANTGRAHLRHFRACVVAHDAHDFLRQMERNLINVNECPTSTPKLAFLFTGYGCQYSGMSKDLYETSPIFQSVLNKCDKILRGEYDVDIKRLLWNESDPAAMSNTIYTAVTIFVIEYAVVELWRSFGVEPDLVVGHSLGEFAAACVAGIISLEDALNVIMTRGQLLEKLPPGNMIAVNASLETSEGILDTLGLNDCVDVAAINSFDQTALSGTMEGITKIKEFCANLGVKSHILEAKQAFHSRMVDPALSDLRKATEKIRYDKPRCRYISGMSGDEVTSLDGEYWVRHTREPVNFVKVCETLKSIDGIIFLEVGPTPILSSFVSRQFDGNLTLPTLLPSLRKNHNDWATMMGSLACLYTAGVDVNWKGVHSHAGGSKISGLPSYPFQRKKFWFKKPKSDCMVSFGKELHPLVNFRIPTAPPSIIFQTRLSVTTSPYIKDHVIGNHIIFPAAGYVEMILAAGQSSVLAEFEGFRPPRQPIILRDFHVEAPLALKDTEDVNLQIIVTPDSVIASSSEGINLNEVTIHRRHEDTSGSKSWVKHVSVKISLLSTAVKDTGDFLQTIDVNHLKQESTCVNIDNFYSMFETVGLNFGNTFRSLRGVWGGETESLTEIVAPSGNNFLTHPVAIDAMLQSLMAAIHREVSQLLVPVKIREFTWFAASPESSKYYVHVTNHASSAVLYDENGCILAGMKGVTLIPTTTGAIDNALEAQNLVIPTFLEDVWIPSKASICANLPFYDIPKELPEENNEETTKLETRLEVAAECKMVDIRAALQCLWAFLKLGWVAKVQEDVEIQCFCVEMGICSKFYLMTRRMLEIISQHTDYVTFNDVTFRVNKTLPNIETIENQMKEIDTFTRHFRPEVECFEAVREMTPSVLQSKDSVLPILFGDESVAEKLYVDSLRYTEANVVVANFVRSICGRVQGDELKRQTLRILEVGAGTGGTTRFVLPVLEESGVDFIYTFTDVSAGFFSKAPLKFAQWKEWMEFQPLDIEKDPKVQGFLHENYDIIIAANVLHATRNLTETMRNVRHLLRPNGVAVLVEAYKPEPQVDVVFGLVDGFWRFEDFETRPHHCILPKTSWPQLLASTGFSSHQFSSNAHVILANASSSSPNYLTPASLTKDTWVLLPKDAAFSHAVVNQIQCIGRKAVYNVELDSVASILQSGNVEGIVFLADSQKNDGKTTRSFLHLLQALISYSSLTPPKLVVVTRGACVVGDQGTGFPNDATLWGMSRSFRSENPNWTCLNVDVDPHESLEKNAQSLLSLLWASKDEFVAVRKNKTFTLKLKTLKLKNKLLFRSQNSQKSQLIFPKSNLISDLQFGGLSLPKVTGDQVELKVMAAGLNFRDLLSVLKPLKQFNIKESVGADVAGLVTAVGPDVQNLRIGDVVVGCSYLAGGLPSHVILHENCTVRLPANWTFADGSTIPTTFATAYHSLVEVAGLQKGETILIHTASGGVGLAAIQIAKEIGVKIIATAGSRRKRAYLREIVGITDVFHSRDLSYEIEIMGVTNGRGVDVVLNSLTGPGFKEATIKVCANECRFIEMSKLNIWNECDVQNLRPDVKYTIVDLSAFGRESWTRVYSYMEEFLKQGKLKPLPYVAFEALDVRAALTHLQNAQHIGKVVCTFPENTVDEVSGSNKVGLFHAESSYLITGGLGGIGLEAAKWIASEGAKFIVLCGRSSPSAKANDVIACLNASGKAVLAVNTDIGNLEDCKRLVDSINNGVLSVNGSTFPPLRGIQHAAGCLSDGMIPNQTWEKYEQTLHGKVRGAWHLHELTKTAAFPLEHFVMYSSGAAIFGPMGQSSHAAANSFLDSLAHFRNARGLAATSINWGQWGQIGVAADIELTAFTPFTPLQGFTSLKQILRHHKAQVTVVQADVSKFRSAYPWMYRNGYASELADASPSKAIETASNDPLKTESFWKGIEEAKSSSPLAVELKIRVLLVEIVSRILKVAESEQVDIHQNFQDIGLDSLMMVELKNLLQGTLGPKVTVTANLISEANSIEKLTKKINELIILDGTENDSTQDNIN